MIREHTILTIAEHYKQAPSEVRDAIHHVIGLLSEDEHQQYLDSLPKEPIGTDKKATHQTKGIVDVFDENALKDIVNSSMNKLEGSVVHPLWRAALTQLATSADHLQLLLNRSKELPAGRTIGTETKQ